MAERTSESSEWNYVGWNTAFFWSNMIKTLYGDFMSAGAGLPDPVSKTFIAKSTFTEVFQDLDFIGQEAGPSLYG